jgi:hypothetical protein
MSPPLHLFSPQNKGKSGTELYAQMTPKKRLSDPGSKKIETENQKSASIH